ncbi:MAG: leucine-rich repeat domain-containing protein [Verrucomicrobia bacterium]|nr:leucine-rich repeat domain-containing protein [Verrucomicrobiota bacterium]
MTSNDLGCILSTGLSPYWNQLTGSNIPEELFPIAKLAREIDVQHHEFNVEQKFSKLYQVLQTKGYRYSGLLPTTLEDFTQMRSQFLLDCDEALCNIAKEERILDCNATTCEFTEQDTPTQKAEKVRAWLRTHSVDEIPGLRLDGLNLKVLPPEIPQHFSRIRSLDISNNQLQSIDLQHLPALGLLDLSNNHLQAIDLQNQRALQMLYLAHNRLQAINLEYQSALTHLDLSNNQLQFIALNHQTALKHLDLSNNQLQTIDLQKLPSLENLNLAGNQLREIDLQSPPSSLQLLCRLNGQYQWADAQTLHSLRHLNLANNLLQEIDLQDLSGLDSLNLANNPLKSVDLWNQNRLTYLELPTQCKMELLAQHAVRVEIPNHVKACFSADPSETHPVMGPKDVRQDLRDELDGRLKQAGFWNGIYDIDCYGIITEDMRFDLSREKIERFYRALPIDDEVKNAFHEYDADVKNRVYGKVWELAGSPEGDRWWGEHHVFDDAYFFYSALGHVLYPKSSSCTLL